MDHGYVKAEKAVIRMFDRHQEDSAVAMSLDYKTKIQQWAQQSSKKVEYRLQSEAMVNGQIEYQMQILLDGESAGIGTGTSKKRAEHAAAREASRNIPL
jgi:ribonuclease-3